MKIKIFIFINLVTILSFDAEMDGGAIDFECIGAVRGLSALVENGILGSNLRDDVIPVAT